MKPPKAEIIHPIILIPPKEAREAGSKKIPEPIILPITNAVAPDSPTCLFVVVVVKIDKKLQDNTGGTGFAESPV